MAVLCKGTEGLYDYWLFKKGDKIKCVLPESDSEYLWSEAKKLKELGIMTVIDILSTKEEASRKCWQRFRVDKYSGEFGSIAKWWAPVQISLKDANTTEELNFAVKYLLLES
jgi:hypothetical protein